MNGPEFSPTHVAPRDGLSAWSAVDQPHPTAWLDPLLPVRVIDRAGDWSRVVCSNGWSAWVDGRLLVAIPQGPPAAGHPAARTADPRPMLARVESALGRYRWTVEERAAGRADGEAFARATSGVRVGLVIDGDAVWLYDSEQDRWCYCDGTELTTYATTELPSTAHRDDEDATATTPAATGPEQPTRLDGP